MCRSAPLRTSNIEQLLEEEQQQQQQDIQFDDDPVESEPLDTLDYYHQEEEEEEPDLHARAMEEGRQWAVYQGLESPRDEDDWRSIRDDANLGLSLVLGVEVSVDEWEPVQQ